MDIFYSELQLVNFLSLLRIIFNKKKGVRKIKINNPYEVRIHHIVGECISTRYFSTVYPSWRVNIL